jgi:peptidoglycan/xylan/chitin deacetylase (PgdA/CDA1 family)
MAQRAARLVMPRFVVVWHGPRTRRRVALTFDDGPSPLTREYLDLLEHHDARATFFVIGEYCREQRALLDEMLDRGHEIAEHGYSHRRFPEAAERRELGRELARTRALLPTRARRWVRPPFGSCSPTSVFACARRGYRTVLWSHDSDDCRSKDPFEIARKVSPAAIDPGSIVLLHDGQNWTLEALAEVLRGLRGAGYSLVTVGRLLEDSA